MAKLEEPLEEDEAIQPENVEAVLDLDSEFPTSYALLESGYTYSAVETVYEDVSPGLFFAYLG